MHISVNWLKDWVDYKGSVDTLAAQLTMAGLEVDGVSAAAPDFSGVVVGQITSIAAHPNADKLRICTVNIGTKNPLTIVCGAANAREQMKVAVATLGAVLPKMEIKPVAIRDVDSEGMLCSESELGMADSAEGILDLPAEAKVGMDIRNFYQLNDSVIEVDMTPNRGDCLGMIGVAREVAVIAKTVVHEPTFTHAKISHKQKFEINVQVPDACPRYLGRVLTGLNASAQTPVWMQERLRRSGIRSLGPLVDVTNYVLLEYGQPMHAFDLSTLQGKITVRLAQPKETLTLLDGKQVELADDVLLICDDKKPLALAGIMGGEGSGISDSTTDIFLECAYFNPVSIAGRARKYGLQTDSSYRFERGVDPAIQQQATERATQLLLDICGGSAGPVNEVVSPKHLPKPATIKLRQARLESLLGMPLKGNDISSILKSLGMSLAVIKASDKNKSKSSNKTKSSNKIKTQVVSQDEWMVTAPSWRFDIAIEADLVEEVGRIIGYDNIPTRMPTGELTAKPRSETTLGLQRFNYLLVDRGFQEVITYSFVEPGLQSQLFPDRAAVALTNPISSDMSVMRTSLWTGLLQTVKYNLNRQQSRVRIFESGQVFNPGSKGMSDIAQTMTLGGAICGPTSQEQWGQDTQGSDFYDLKADLEALFSLTGEADSIEFIPATHSALHPGQTAKIKRAGQDLGWIGMLHPEILKKQSITVDVCLFELDLAILETTKVPVFSSLSKFPSIRRDLSIVVDESITSQQIRATIAEAVPDQLSEVHVFDVYRGKGVDSGRKSLALGLILQETSRTLVDKEVDAAIEWVVVKLQKELGASLRE
ncbi:Phenylalanyl-tRNA synthetase beta chain [hydrothermal vent metagenome]|uniref:Phenylalanine--tRNA ligase beta subunit n=1 Tax=hydrothermal vent metagenome TaxID=652676 RepID=A0A3B0YNL4_9ZZZZ